VQLIEIVIESSGCKHLNEVANVAQAIVVLAIVLVLGSYGLSHQRICPKRRP